MFGGIASRVGKLFSSLKSKTSLQAAELENLLHELSICLLDGDVDTELVGKITSKMRSDILGSPMLFRTTESVQKKIHDVMVGFLKKSTDLNLKNFDIIFLVGPKSVGKTTMTGKLAADLRRNSIGIAITSIDFVRAAAQDQTKLISKQAECDFLPLDLHKETDQQKISDAILNLQKNCGKKIIVDTVGILNEGELDSLAFIAALKSKAKVCTLLVVDSMLGRGGISSAKKISNAMTIDGIIISKMDSDTKGGAAISLCCLSDAPVIFLGTGEKINDIEPFDPNGIAGRILGIGDLDGLFGAMARNVTQDDMTNISAKLSSGSFDMHDFYKYAKMLQNMGGMSFLRGFMPKIGPDIKADGMDAFVKIAIAAYNSMTHEERNNPSILTNQSRRMRIAKGAALNIREVDDLLMKYNQMSGFIKQMGKMRA